MKLFSKFRKPFAAPTVKDECERRIAEADALITSCNNKIKALEYQRMIAVSSLQINLKYMEKEYGPN